MVYNLDDYADAAPAGCTRTYALDPEQEGLTIDETSGAVSLTLTSAKESYSYSIVVTSTGGTDDTGAATDE